MPENHVKFHSANGKRRVLVVEDEALNRALLEQILKDTYEVVFAEDGIEAMEKIREQKDIISLVLLDLIMPRMSGQEVLREIRGSSDYQDIPVIVASADSSQEIQCLNEGASDFIQKPYPEPGIICARIQRAIELFESRRTIASTERDPLTGLYNREFFYRYADQYDQFHKDKEMDAIVIDINHFGLVNERYGKAYADEILKRIGEKTRSAVADSGGIVCRRESDIFLIYCPHREDYKAFLDSISSGISDEQDASRRIRLRMGVYSNVDKSLEIERRFDRAKMASDTVRGNFARNIGVYDDSLHKSELYSQKLVEDFQTAIDQKQFLVYFQPKYNIKSDTPRLCGAEGLVRWKHPELGMISPGVFIPLFEHNGLIQALDQYVWREAARQIRAWKDKFGFSVPVSVNVSRIDMYDPNFVYTLLDIVESNKLEAADLHLEITETAYAEDAEQIIEVVKRLRAIGFLVEMDDFGTGYSSLNMLSALPIDILKLDMKFIQHAVSQEGDRHMLTVVVEIANHLSAPVVAEGVETDEQIALLKEVGCDIVQGYYFSPPVSEDRFEQFLTEAKEAEGIHKEETAESPKKTKKETQKKDPLTERVGRRYNIPMRKARAFFGVLAIIVAAALLVIGFLVRDSYIRMDHADDYHILVLQSANALESASDYLTENVRDFVVTGDPSYLDNYFEEAEITKRRDHAVENLSELKDSSNQESYERLSNALALSNELMDLEYRAMRCMFESGEADASKIRPEIRDYPLREEDLDLSPEELRDHAIELVYGDEYNSYKERIKEETRLCTEKLVDNSARERERLHKYLNRLMVWQFLLTILMLIVVFGIIAFVLIWIHIPLEKLVAKMRKRETVSPVGAREMRYVSETYNMIFEENRKTHERLTYGNLHDALTGLYNRSAYDFMKTDLDMTQNALVLVDVDRFKMINDTYGHDVGDQVLIRVADVLKYSFRSTDLVFRLGGDEFVVIMSNVSVSMSDQVKKTIEQANVMLQKPNDDLPPVSLSVGVAFADRPNPEGDIFKDADTALYRVKQAGRCGCEIF